MFHYQYLSPCLRSRQKKRKSLGKDAYSTVSPPNGLEESRRSRALLEGKWLSACTAAFPKALERRQASRHPAPTPTPGASIHDVAEVFTAFLSCHRSTWHWWKSPCPGPWGLSLEHSLHLPPRLAPNSIMRLGANVVFTCLSFRVFYSSLWLL